MKLSLATKVFGGLFLLLATVALLAFLGAQRIRVLGDDVASMKNGYLRMARLTAEVDTHQQNRVSYLRLALEQRDGQERLDILRLSRAYHPNKIRATLEKMRAVARRQVERLKKLGFKEAHFGVTLFGGMDDYVDRIVAHNEALDDLTENVESMSGPDVDLTAFSEQLSDIERELRGTTYELNNHIGEASDQNAEQVRQHMDETERDVIWGAVILTAVALAIGLFIMVLTERSLAPVRRLVVYARAISRGDYQRSVEVTESDELASLADELRLMARSRKDREDELDRQADELEEAYRRVEELKRYHESIVRSLRTGVVVTNRELTITSTNRAAKSHWDLEGVKGSQLETTALGHALDTRPELMMRTIADRPQTVTADALPLGDHLADVTVAPLENEAGAVLGLVIALEDVTEAVHTKEALLRSERLATIGRMSAHVTHEIRNPLSSIGLNAELLEDITRKVDGKDGEEALAMCRAIAREVDRLTAITEAYLKFARLPRPDLADEDLGTLLQTIAAFVRRDLDAAKVALSMDLPSPAPTVRLDADQMRQAILNLVRNAKEAMPEGGRIEIGATVVEDALQIRVKDEGVGIPDDHQERIFDPFYSTKLTGTGLGLALTQQIVQEHGGRLTLSSRVGEGTEFAITLPLEQAAKMTHVLEA